jgi:hypothetical protein
MNTDKKQIGRARHSVRAACEILRDGAREATRPTDDENKSRCFELGCRKFRHGESQRDSIIQPRVARHELPWVCDATEYNPEGVESVCARRRCNPVGVGNYFGRLPRVVRCAANPGLNDSIPLGLKWSAGFSPLQLPNAFDVRTLKRPEGRAPVNLFIRVHPCPSVVNKFRVHSWL